MLRLLILKEIKALILSPKFTITLAVCSLVIVVSMYTGISEYKESQKLYELAQQIDQTNFEEARSVNSVYSTVNRKPNPMHIVASGLTFDIGRITRIGQWREPDFIHSTYEETPIFALFRMLDLNFIFQVILTLFAILFTYDAISREREDGTLKLVFSNTIPRAGFIVAKIVGAALGLFLPLFIPILIGLIFIQLFGVVLTSEEWIRILTFIGAGFLLLLVYQSVGVMVSSYVKKSATSFLILLAFWTITVLILPRAGIIAADSFIPSLSDAQLSSMKSAFQQQQWTEHSMKISQKYQERNAVRENMTAEEFQAYREEKEWEWMEEDEQMRNEMNREVDEYAKRLIEEEGNKQRLKERLAFNIARFSPTASFHLFALNLAQTDTELKTRYLLEANRYKGEFVRYIKQKQKESGTQSGFNINVDSEAGVKIDFGRDVKVDFSDRPRFQHPEVLISSVVQKSVTDLSVLTGFLFVSLAAAFIGFLRYDLT